MSHSKTDERKAQELARSVFDESEFTGNRYLRLVTSAPLHQGDTVHVKTDAPSDLLWSVPSAGHVVRLHEFPNRHAPTKKLRNVVCFVFEDKSATNLVSETNTYSVDVMISELAKDWSAF